MSGRKKDPPKLRKVLAASASSFTNLGLVGAAAITAAALASWPIIAIGGAAYAALVAWDVANPDFWKKTLGKAGPQTTKLPVPGKIADKGFAQAILGILAARQEIAKTLKETPADVTANLSGAIAQVAELERHAVILVERGEDLSKYLQTVDREKIHKAKDGLRERGRRSANPDAKAQYASAQAVRDEQLKAIADIDGAREQIGAKLATIVATLEALPAKIVRMRALDAQAVDDLSGNVNDELARMNSEIQVFEETSPSLAEVANP